MSTTIPCFSIRLSQLSDYLWVGPHDVPIHKSVLEKLSKIFALGFNISDRSHLDTITTYLGDTALVDAIHNDIQPDVWTHIYNYISGKGPSQVTTSPKSPHSPDPTIDVVDVADVAPSSDPSEMDVYSDPDKVEMSHIQKLLRGGSIFSLRLSQLEHPLPPGISVPIGDIQDLLVLLKDAGFKVTDRNLLLQALSVLSGDGGTFATVATSAIPFIGYMPDKDFNGLFTRDLRYTEDGNVPSESPASLDAPQSSGSSAPTVPVPATPAGNFGGGAVGRSKQIADFANRYEDIQKGLPQAVVLAPYDSTIPNVMLWPKSGGKSPNVPAKGGMFVKEFDTSGDTPTPGRDAIVVGSTPSGMLAVRTFPDGQFDAWDARHSLIRISSLTAPKRDF